MTVIKVNSVNYLEYRKGADKIFNKFSREVGWVVFDKNYPSKLDNSEVTFLCVENDLGQVIGSLVSYRRKDKSSKILALAVSKDWQGIGVGTTLVKSLKEESPNLEVSCLEDLENSNKFYVSRGFKLHNTKLTRIGNNVNVYRNYD